MNRDAYFQAIDAVLPELRAHLQQVAERFALDFRADDYHYLVMTAEEKVLLDYLADCPGLPHSNWGDELPERRRRVADFLASEEFRAYCAQLSSGGSVLGSEVIDELLACRQSLPEWAEALSDRLAQHPALRQPFFVAICLQEASEALLQRQTRLLVHEWSHLLFFSNGIQFQKTAPEHPDAWLYDEGLATWVEYAWVTGDWDCERRLDELHQLLLESGRPRSVTGYFEMGLWFNAHFKALPATVWPQTLLTLADRLPDAQAEPAVS